MIAHWEHLFGDAKSTRLSVSLDLRQWLIGLAWASQDVVFDFFCLSIMLDWFEPHA